MAAIRKHRNKWQVRVRRKGHPVLCKSFNQKTDALAWARDQEIALDRGHLFQNKTVAPLLLSDAIERYKEEVSRVKRGHRSEAYRLDALKRHPIAAQDMRHILSQTIADYRDARLKQVSPASVRKELYLLSSIFKTSEREWGFEGLANPIERISIPSGKTNRGGRLDAETKERLLDALEGCTHPNLPNIVTVALETAMRRSEILSLTWRDIDFDRLVVYVPHTKNGEARYIPLTDKALSVIQKSPKESTNVFPISANAVRLAWERFKKSAGIDHVRFHDLRHEAISNMFEKGLTFPEVASISGHKTPSMLFRYAHANPKTCQKKLNIEG